MVNKTLILATIIFLLQSGCNLSPKIDREEITPQKQTFLNQKDSNKTLWEQEWWKEFNDKNLNKFVKEIAENSIDIKNAKLTAEKFFLLYKTSSSALWPSISLTTGATRSKTNLGTFLPQGGSFKKTTYSFSFNASYEIDLFDKLSNSKKQAYYTLLSAKENEKAIQLSITANAVKLYLQYSQLLEEIEKTKEEIKVRKLLYKSAYSKYINGVIPSDVYLAYLTLLNQSENMLKQLEEIKSELEHTIKQIASSTEFNFKVSDFAKLSLKLPPVKPGLPSELLLRRPDIQFAYMQIKSQACQVGIDKASLFPSIKITGSDGFQSTSLSKLFKHESNVWNFGINLFQSIFNRGALKNKVEISRKDLEISINDYKKTVINAFGEVDKLLAQCRLIKEEIENLEKNLKSQKLTEKKKLEDYMSGNDTYEAYLNQRINLITTEITLSRLYLAYALNRVSLYKALGGGIEKINQLTIEVKK